MRSPTNAWLLLSLLLSACSGQSGPRTDGAALDGPTPDYGLPTCPRGAAFGAPCDPPQPQCAIPGASTEASPLFCLCGCGQQRCHWETDQVAPLPCDSGAPVDAGRD